MSRSSEPTVDLYRVILKGRLWLIAVATICGGALAALALWLLPPKYEATTSVQITPITADLFEVSQRPSALIDRQTEATVARSMAVAELAVKELDNSLTVKEVRDATSIAPIADTTILNISFQADNEDIARAGADAMAQAYLAYRAAQAELEVGTLLDRLASRLEELRQDLGTANSLAALAEPDSREASQAISDRDLIMVELNGLVSRKNTLDGISTDGGSILTSASGNQIVVSPSRSMLLASGVLGGFLIGVVASFTLRTSKIRLRSAKEIETLTGVPVLGRAPNISDSNSVPSTDLAPLLNLREEILHTLPAGTILLLDHADVGREIAIQLATQLAKSGAPVELYTAWDEQLDPKTMGFSSREFELDPDDTELSANPYVLDEIPALKLFISNNGDKFENFDSTLTNILPQQINAGAENSFHIIYLQSTELSTTLLTAIRFTDLALITLRLRSTSRGSFSEIANTFYHYGVEKVGVVLATGRKKKNRAAARKESASKKKG